MQRFMPSFALLMLTVFATANACAQAAPPSAASSHARYFALRLRPHDDLFASLKAFAKEHQLHAAFVASCAGSASHTSVRYANQPSATARDGHFEIVSLSGTLTGEGGHLHIALADSTGATFGGHLMDGTTIYTTAEIVLGELSDVTFTRAPDSTYGYRELLPLPRPGATAARPGR